MYRKMDMYSILLLLASFWYPCVHANHVVLVEQVLVEQLTETLNLYLDQTNTQVKGNNIVPCSNASSSLLASVLTCLNVINNTINTDDAFIISVVDTVAKKISITDQILCSRLEVSESQVCVLNETLIDLQSNIESLQQTVSLNDVVLCSKIENFESLYDFLNNIVVFFQEQTVTVLDELSITLGTLGAQQDIDDIIVLLRVAGSLVFAA